MDEIAIRCEELSKRYRIGERQSYGTLRETLTEVVTSPLRRLRGAAQTAPALKGNGDNTILALSDVSFEVKRGEVVGFIGRNGAGKSTLLKILSRITKPSEGYVELKGRVSSLLEVGTGFHPELTGRENIYLNGAILGMKKAEIDRNFDEIVAFAEISKFIDTPVKRYSSGMYMRLAFSVAAHLEPEILIIDEVLAVGDEGFQKKCLGKMGDVAKAGRTVVFVSHNMSVVQNLCTRAIVLDKGKAIRADSLEKAIDIYLGQNHANEIVFKNKALKSASVKQVDDKIIISAEYQVDQELLLPCLGFVISDHFGNPICGSNPIVDSVPPLLTPRKSGQIKVVLNYPHLLNGFYRLSLWFGNGRQEYFIEKDCLTFDVVNMTAVKQLPAAVVGPVSPSCDWVID